MDHRHHVAVRCPALRTMRVTRPPRPGRIARHDVSEFNGTIDEQADEQPVRIDMHPRVAQAEGI